MKGLNVTNWYETSPAGMELIKRFEGCEKRLPNNRLQAYKKPGDPWTIGWGQTGAMPDGRPVVEGLTITQQEADEALVWFVKNVSDPLTRKHFNAQSQNEFDALSSWVYNINHTKLERGEYTLPALVNLRTRDIDAVIAKWIQYKNPNTIFEQGLYRRRLAELCVFLGLPWHFALSAVLKRREGVIVDMTDPNYILSLAEAAKPIPQAPDPPKAPAPVVPVEITPLPEVKPPVDATLPPKKIEESRTGKAVNRASRGKETVAISTIGTVLAGLATQIEIIGRSLENIGTDTMIRVALFGFICLAGMGAYWWWSGRNEAYHRRLETQDPKY
jgi:GH24 family phage-related lysozyme (muramidase)